MKVTVKQIDINRGEVGEPEKCPVARAIRRALGYPKGYTAEVGIGTWDIGNQDKWMADLPKKAVEFITDFDNYGADAVAPFSFVTRRPR